MLLNIRNSTRMSALVIDMQACFLYDLDSSDLGGLIRSQIGFIKHLRKKEIPIYLIEHKMGFRTIKPIRTATGKYSKLIRKYYRSGFSNTGLDDALRGIYADHLLVLGVYSLSCIKDTIVDALQMGYRVSTSLDLIRPHPNDQGVNTPLDFSDSQQLTLYKNYKDLNQSLKI